MGVSMILAKISNADVAIKDNCLLKGVASSVTVALFPAKSGIPEAVNSLDIHKNSDWSIYQLQSNDDYYIDVVVTGRSSHQIQAITFTASEFYKNHIELNIANSGSNKCMLTKQVTALHSGGTGRLPW